MIVVDGVVDGVATVNVTGMETGEAPVALMVNKALYVPAVREPVATVAVMVPVPVPEAGLTLSQVALPLAVQARVPPPVLLIVRACVAGLAPPCWAVKDKLLELRLMAGFAGAGGEVEEFAGTTI